MNKLAQEARDLMQQGAQVSVALCNLLPDMEAEYGNNRHALQIPLLPRDGVMQAFEAETDDLLTAIGEVHGFLLQKHFEKYGLTLTSAE